MPERTIRAAGGVLWRRVDGQVRVALVHRPKYDDWSLPKGRLDTGELPVTAAVREVAEETGFAAAAGRTLGTSAYRVLDRGRDVAKSVRWWAMQAVEGAFVPGSEVDAMRWLPVPSALAQVTSGYDVAPLTAFGEGPAETTTALLAGVPGGMHRLADVVGAYRPRRVVCAPGAGRDAARPLVEALGLRVGPEQGPVAGVLTALRECALVLAPPDAVAAAMQELGGGRPRGHAAMWALSLASGRVVDIDRPLG